MFTRLFAVWNYHYISFVKWIFEQENCWTKLLTDPYLKCEHSITQLSYVRWRWWCIDKEFTEGEEKMTEKNCIFERLDTLVLLYFCAWIGVCVRACGRVSVSACVCACMRVSVNATYSWTSALCVFVWVFMYSGVRQHLFRWTERVHDGYMDMDM